MSSEFVNAIAVIVLGGVFVSAVSGNVLMFRQIGQLQKSIEHLTGALRDLGTDLERERVNGREEDRILHKRIDRLKQSGC